MKKSPRSKRGLPFPAVAVILMILIIAAGFPKISNYLKTTPWFNLFTPIKDDSSAFPSPTPTPDVYKLSETSRNWLLAVGAPLDFKNGIPFYSIGCNCTSDKAKADLNDSWGITDRKSTLSTLDWLKYAGHSQQLDEVYNVVIHMASSEAEYQGKRGDLIRYIETNQSDRNLIFLFDFVWKNRKEFADKKLYAWDSVRMNVLARWAYQATYINEKEMWEYLLFAGQRLQKHYSSWDEVGRHYVLGRVFWQADNNQQDMEYIVNWLGSNPTSPWVENKWNTDLTK